LCEGSLGGERGVHIGTPKQPKSSADSKLKAKEDTTEDDLDTDPNDPNEQVPRKVYSDAERKEYAFLIKAKMDAQNLALNETAYTALVRILCKTGDVEEADELIRQAEGCAQCKPKLRMYSALISAFCERGELAGALRVWARMTSLKRKNKTGTVDIITELTEREYCMFIKCATKVGDVKVMDRVLSDLAEDVLVPSLETTNAIIEWFESEHAIGGASNVESASALDKVPELSSTVAPSLGPLQYPVEGREETNSPHWEMSNAVPIDAKCGTLKTGCLEGKNLKPVALSSKAWKAMIDMNEDIVLKGEVEEHGKISDFAGGGKGKKRILTKDAMEQRTRNWNSFIQYLSTKYGPSSFEQDGEDARPSTLDMVIDGANIGYYKQNFAYAPKHVDYRQIDRVVEDLKKDGKSVLLFLHIRHFGKLMPSYAETIVDKWERAGILYRTPHGSNDDWFWMHAALWVGRGTMVLSNDEMRDHHFQMLAHRSFLRWKERHQVHFDLEGRKVVLAYPDVYSRRIQKLDDHSLVIPLPKQGDENRFLDGGHEADESASGEETYVCINLKR